MNRFESSTLYDQKLREDVQGIRRSGLIIAAMYVVTLGVVGAYGALFPPPNRTWLSAFFPAITSVALIFAALIPTGLTFRLIQSGGGEPRDWIAWASVVLVAASSVIGAVGMGLALVDYLSVEPLALFVVPSGAVRAVLSSAFVRADHEQGRLVKSSIPSSIVLAWSAAVVALDVALNGFRSGISQYDYIMALTFSMVLGAFVHTQDFQGTMVSRPLTVAEQVLLSLGQAVVVFAVSFAFSPGLGLVVRFLG